MVVNWDLISLIVFYLLLLLLYFLFKQKFETQGLLVMYKTKLGLTWMDALAKKFPRLIALFAYSGIIVGFVGMLGILSFLFVGTWNLLTVPGAEPVIAPLLPGVEIAGAPTLSFWHWILAIFFVAIIHEFSHGVVARSFSLPIKSSGFVFFGPLLGAFVEPDEKELEKVSFQKQLSVFAAGPFSNLVAGGLVFLFLIFVFLPVVSQLYVPNGVTATIVMVGYPVNMSGIEAPFTITAVNGNETKDFATFVDVLSLAKPGDIITLETNKGVYAVTTVANPEDSTKAFLGVSGFEQEKKVKETVAFLEPLSPVLDWLGLLILWIFLVHLGVGLFNLLPLGPLDGGRMFYSAALFFFKDKTRAKRALVATTIVSLLLIFINLLPFINKLFVWIWHALLTLLTLFF